MFGLIGATPTEAPLLRLRKASRRLACNNFTDEHTAEQGRVRVSPMMDTEGMALCIVRRPPPRNTPPATGLKSQRTSHSLEAALRRSRDPTTAHQPGSLLIPVRRANSPRRRESRT